MSDPISSFLIATAIFGLLGFMRVKVFQMLAEAHGRHFCFGPGFRVMLNVLGSAVIPGLGQATRGRMIAAFLHLGIFLLAFHSMGEAALFFNLASAMEHAFN